MSETTAVDIGRHLERHLQAHGGDGLIYYGDLISLFVDLPPFDGNWSAHPLCKLFDELDREDASLARPFRTALVVRRKDNLPGPGFFKALADYTDKGKPITREKDRVAVHAEQLSMLVEHYRHL